MTETLVAGAGPRPLDDTRIPLIITLPDSRLRLLRAAATAVVIGPLIGTVLAAGLAVWRGGVSAPALVALAITYCATTLAVTVGFHRYFSHRSFRTARAMEVLFVVLGSAALQGTLLYWVSQHRRHHQFSDSSLDPHSPHYCADGPHSGFRGFWHGHVGWMFARQISNPVRFAPDIIKDSLIFQLQRHYWAWALALLLLPPAIVALAGADSWTIAETFLWAGPVRIFLLHHVSWAVGSISHLYGARPFDTGDHSANNFWVALFGFGEGLQNNHHAFPRAAIHAFQWREPDFSGVVIRGLAALGVVWDLNRPTPALIAARRRSRLASDGEGK